jgi:hypothetical protein
MKEITSRDLTQFLTLLLPEREDDGEGGWKDIWKKGPPIWASLFPVMGKSGFHPEDLGGSMASHEGFLKSLPSPHYQLIVRAGIDIPLRAGFLWRLSNGTKRLMMVSSPTLIQFNRFLKMTVVETKNA